MKVTTLRSSFLKGVDVDEYITIDKKYSFFVLIGQGHRKNKDFKIYE